jgi:hypothetical protein
MRLAVVAAVGAAVILGGWREGGRGSWQLIPTTPGVHGQVAMSSFEDTVFGIDP